MKLTETIQFLFTPPDSSLLYLGSYNPVLVVLSILIAIFASYAALSVSSRIAIAERSSLKLAWITVGALAMGSGVWAMHFIGMLSLNLPCGIFYDPVGTLLSMAPGILASGVALTVIGHSRIGQLPLIGGSLLLGAGIGVMHYSGMAAMRLDGMLRYDPKLFGLSIIVAVLLAYVALWVKFGLQSMDRGRDMVSAIVMGCAVSGMHYTATAATYFVRGSAEIPASALSTTDLAIITTTVTGLLAALALALSIAYRNQETVRRLQKSERSLEQSSVLVRKLSQVVEQSATSAIITDKQGIIEYVNSSFSVNSGYTPEEVIGRKPSILGSGETSPEIYAQLWGAITAGGTWRGELRNRRKDGRLYWDCVTINPMRNETGDITHFVAVQEDITARKENDEQLQLFLRVVNHVSEGITITDANKNIVYVNPAFTAITGYSADEVIGKNPRILHSGLMDEAFYREMWRSINEAGCWQGEIIDRRKGGESYAEWLSINVLKNERGEASHYIAAFSDISERKAVEERVAYMAQHDFLTGLPNRMLLNDRLAQALVNAGREGGKVAVIFLDLDRFKAINDTLGHITGDKLLQEIAARIGGVVRASDTVCRQGGDEFVIMLNDVDAVDDVATVATKLLASISRMCLIEGNEIEVSTSIGISVFPEDGSDSETLIKHADAAMYHAKENGRNNYQFFTSEMNQLALEHMTMGRKLRHALERNEFCLHYQPQVDLRSGHIIGAEALLRWNHPELGMVSPAQFIPVAEENGLIVPIGEWVLREACRQNCIWRSLGLPEIVMAVNLSAVQFRQKNLGETIMGILHESGLDPSGLELEITESAVMQNAEAAILLLEQMKTMGLKLSVDDFGTGYSSLGYLKKFPIDKLKIDQSFVRDLMTDPDDAAIVGTIISMAHNLKLKAIAEGVETAEQLAFLKQNGCDEMQGYYFSRPVSAEKFTALLASGKQQ